MKYIESLELREWVKDNLKKTIFQKAHALAIQTGCQILVKLEDDTDFTQHQYYATDRLRKVFKNAGLRQQSEEKFVSGVTGEPLIDQAIQSDHYDDHSQETLSGLQTGFSMQMTSTQTSTESVVDSERIPSGDANEVEGQTDDDQVKTEVASGSDYVAIPMNIAMTCETSEDSGLNTMQTDSSRTIGEDGGDVDDGSGDVVPRVKIKQEPMDDNNHEHEEDHSTSLYQDTTATTTTSQSDSQTTQFQGATQAPSTTQYLSSLSYQVPASPKPYQCAMCGKAFRSVQVLQKHTHTFHMKTRHEMAGRMGRGRGRGRLPIGPSGPRLTHIGHAGGASSTQSNSFTCVICNINFPEVEILQDHMSRTHLGASTSSAPPPPHSEGDLDNPEYPTPGTSQQPHTFPSPSGDTPAAQGAPYSQQVGTSSSSVPIFPRPVSSASGSRASTSPGTARIVVPVNETPTGQVMVLLSEEERIWTLLDVLQRNARGKTTAVRLKPNILESYKDLKEAGRGKLARAIMVDLFTVEERVISNCRGSMGKPPLDPVRLQAVHDAVFELLPCERETQIVEAWDNCVLVIDTANRGLKRRKIFKNVR